MPDNQQPVRRRSSFGVLFSFLLVVSLIVIAVYALNQGSDPINRIQFASALVNDRVYSLNVTVKDNSVVNLSGYYYANNGEH